MNRVGLALVTALVATAARAQIFPSGVQSPLPGKQGALLLAFSEEHNISTFQGQPLPCTSNLCSFMAQLGSDLQKRGYADVTTMIATSYNQLPPQEGQGYYTVQDFENALSGTNAGRYGVVVSYGHAGGTDAGIAVENYTTDTILNTRFVDLIENEGYSSNEIKEFAPSSDQTEKVIAIKQAFITNRAKLAQTYFSSLREIPPPIFSSRDFLAHPVS